MAKYSNPLSVPHPIPIATNIAVQRQVPILVPGEVNMRSNAPSCKFASPGFATINPPFSYYYQMTPENYTKAFTSAGRLVGVNQEVPYPYENILYHQIPFNRAVDWSQTDVFLCEAKSKECMMELLRKRSEAENPKRKPCSTQVEPAEYFTAENDEGYNQWATRQQQENGAKETSTLEKEKAAIPQDIKDLPGHYGPSLLETSNETYGQYIDLLPKYPAIYPQKEKLSPGPLKVMVSFRPTNMSDHPPIPDHAFAVDPREMVNGDCCYNRGINGAIYYPEVPGRQHRTSYTFSNRHKGLGPAAGEKTPGFTFPMYSLTGLELNRPLPQRVGVVAGVGGKEKFRLHVPPRTVPFIYKRYMSYSAPACKDPETEPNPAKIPRKQNCAPCDPKTCVLSSTNPCSLDFINTQILPVPIEIRKHPQL
uniref:Uncharacterized protein n=1 Tax=Biomphalaria glabrata TaxID=6526 RepID=A0A2C9KQ26_BIOGL